MLIEVHNVSKSYPLFEKRRQQFAEVLGLPSSAPTLRALQDAHGASLPPVAFMTAKVQPHEKPLYLQLGAVDVIPKPFDPMTLADTVREVWARAVATPQS